MVEKATKCKVTILGSQKVQADRTTTNNKPDSIDRDTEKGTCVSTDVAISGDRNVIKKEVKKILRYKNITLEVLRMRNFKNRSNTSNSRCNWNHLKITQPIPEQHTG